MRAYRRGRCGVVGKFAIDRAALPFDENKEASPRFLNLTQAEMHVQRPEDVCSSHHPRLSSLLWVRRHHRQPDCPVWAPGPVISHSADALRRLYACRSPSHAQPSPAHSQHARACVRPPQ